MILPLVHYAAVLVLTAIAITGNSQCVLPDQSSIRNLLQFILLSSGGEENIVVHNISEHRFTCMAVDNRIGLFRSISIAIRYNISGPLQPIQSQVSQIQLQCSESSFSPSSTGAIETNPPESVFNSSRRDCLTCAIDGPGVDTDANCIRKCQWSVSVNVNMYCIIICTWMSFNNLACPGDCLGVGQGACTESTCCPYYNGTDGTCIINCTSNVITLDFTCECHFTAIIIIILFVHPCAGSNSIGNASQSSSPLTTAIISHTLTTSSKLRITILS